MTPLSSSSADLEAEKAKYWRVWQHKSYRRNSPGERHAAYFLFRTDRELGDTAIDLGCGTGRAGKFLADYKKKTLAGEIKKINVTLFDLIDAREVDLPFIQGNIWDLQVPVFDWILCCDVLEHMPPQYVDQTLDGMARITRKGGLLTIAHFANSTAEFDDMDVIEDLHLTIEPVSWWKPKIEKRWQVREWEGDIQSRVIIGPPKG